MLSGYLQDYDGGVAPAIALHEVSRRWDEICLAFAEVETDGRVQLRDRVVSGGGGRRSLKETVSLRRVTGQSVSIFIGGAHARFTIPIGAAAASFAASVVELTDRLGIDALDFNFESGVDLSTMTARRAMVALVFDILKKRPLRITFTPEWPSIQGGWTRISESQGSQLWIVDALRKVLSGVHTQYFNNRPVQTPFDRVGSTREMSDGIVSGSRMLLEGFPFADTRFGWFRGLAPRQIGVALPAATAAASHAFLPSFSVNATLNRLATMVGIPVRNVEIAVWSINWDVRGNEAFPTS